MKKPIKPYLQKPYRPVEYIPQKPEEYIFVESDKSTTLIDGSCGMSVKSLLEELKTLDPDSYVECELSYGYYDDVSASVVVKERKQIKNPNYDQQMKQYEKSIVFYKANHKKHMDEYNENMKKYRADKKDFANKIAKHNEDMKKYYEYLTEKREKKAG